VVSELRPATGRGDTGGFRAYRRLAAYALPYWKGLALIACITLLGAGVVLLQPWPMKVVVDHVLSGHEPAGLVAAVISALPGADATAGLLLWAVFAGLLLFAINSTIDVVLTFGWIRVGQGMVYDLAQDLFTRLQRRSLLFHTRVPVGDSMSRVTVDAWCVYTLASSLLVTPIRALLLVGLTTAVMFSLQPSLTLLALAVAPLMALASYRFGKPIRRVARLRREVEARIQSHVQRTLRNIPVVKAFAQEDRERERFEEFADEAIRVHKRGALAMGLFDLGGGFAPAFGAAAVLWFGALLVMEGQLTLGALLVFLAYLTTLQGQLKNLLAVYGTVQNTGASFERVMEVLEAVEEVEERPAAVELGRVRGRVELQDVAFGYEAERPVLQDVSVVVEPGQTLAVVGATGAGKSTLVGLVPRFFDPWQGRVLIDGHDVRDLTLKSLREQISLVLQEPFLFPMSVADNIAYGRPGAMRQEVEAAARAANAHDFICRLAQGYDTVIGERGATLSGGERQRVAIARALLKDTPILILDEPTSALDVETEGLVLEALERLMAGRTTLIIAHRFSTIRNADQVVVLEHGRVVEAGTHEALMSRHGSYRHFHTLQFGPPRLAPSA
jgi:ATP-binding cassette, subfamily B, bacterial